MTNPDQVPTLPRGSSNKVCLPVKSQQNTAVFQFFRQAFYRRQHGKLGQVVVYITIHIPGLHLMRVGHAIFYLSTTPRPRFFLLFVCPGLLLPLDPRGGRFFDHSCCLYGVFFGYAVADIFCWMCGKHSASRRSMSGLTLVLTRRSWEFLGGVLFFPTRSPC